MDVYDAGCRRSSNGGRRNTEVLDHGACGEQKGPVFVGRANGDAVDGKEITIKMMMMLMK
jgi:hypothetical protein